MKRIRLAQTTYAGALRIIQINLSLDIADTFVQRHAFVRPLTGSLQLEVTVFVAPAHRVGICCESSPQWAQSWCREINRPSPGSSG